jgi:hypothetical protein
MHLITSRQIRHLPVLEADRVTGIVSIGALVKSIVTAQDDTIRHLHNYIYFHGMRLRREVDMGWWMSWKVCARFGDWRDRHVTERRMRITGY